MLQPGVVDQQLDAIGADLARGSFDARITESLSAALRTALLKADDIAGGFCAGIERCGVLLALTYPASSNDNPDELSNRLVQEP